MSLTEDYETARRAITLLREYWTRTNFKHGEDWRSCVQEFLEGVKDYPDWEAPVPEVCTTILLFSKDEDSISLAKKIGSDYYQAPGGKQEGSETPFETASRELKEETGIYMPPHSFKLIDTREIVSALNGKKTILHTVKNTHLRETDKPQTTEPEKNQDWFWVTPRWALTYYNLLPGLRAVLEQYYGA